MTPRESHAFIYRIVNGKLVTALRVRCELTQQQVADLSGLSQAAVSRVEQGMTLPGALELHALARAVGSSPVGLDLNTRTAMETMRVVAKRMDVPVPPGNEWAALAEMPSRGVHGLALFVVATMEL